LGLVMKRVTIFFEFDDEGDEGGAEFWVGDKF
jgi:hypothetical protein